MNEINFIIYQTPQGNVAIEAVVKDETLWLTQKAMAELFDCSADNISLHLKNIFASGELDEKATSEESSVVQQEGSRQVNRQQRFYNLDAIISVGYRVNSILALLSKKNKNIPQNICTIQNNSLPLQPKITMYNPLYY